jgi:nucleoside-diphosphate-sugar epimerase
MSATGAASCRQVIAVTGANGFVGRHCVSHLAAGGISARALARYRPEDLPAGVEYHCAPELARGADWRPCVEGAEIVIHCAARVHVMSDTAADPLAEFRRANVDGTLALAKACAAEGVRRFVFVSSIKVNGEETQPGRPFRPADDPRPADPYGVSKLEAENALFELGRQSGMEVAIIRPALVYGPGVKANFRALMKAVAKGIPLPLGKADGLRSLVGVTNLADLLRAASVEPEAAGRVFLAADGHDVTSAQLARCLGEALGRPARLLPVPPGLVAGLARLAGRGAATQRVFGSLQVDIADARRLLGWTPPVTFEEELARTAKAFREEAVTAE